MGFLKLLVVVILLCGIIGIGNAFSYDIEDFYEDFNSSMQKEKTSNPKNEIMEFDN